MKIIGRVKNINELDILYKKHNIDINDDENYEFRFEDEITVLKK